VIEKCEIEQLECLIEVVLNSTSFFDTDSVTEIFSFFNVFTQASTTQIQRCASPCGITQNNCKYIVIII